MDDEKTFLTNRLCCFTCCSPKVAPAKLPPIAMNQPYLFSTPPRPGFQLAPEPPKGKGPSIIYENGLTKEDIPKGFYVSDLSGNS